MMEAVEQGLLGVVDFNKAETTIPADRDTIVAHMHHGRSVQQPPHSNIL